jgi:glutaredoxin
MYELYQAEWCPYSSFVREQLTERGVDFIARQVPAAKSERTEMQARTGENSVPVLVAGDRVIARFEEILAYLGEHHPRRPDADVHRQRYADRDEQEERNILLRQHG